MVAVSVVIPLYNKADTVARAIASVLAQTMETFELLIVDDGSTDAGPQIVSKLSDARIKIVRQENAGVSVARNAGIQAASADLVAFLDADDEWRPEFLRTICALKAAHPGCGVYGTSYEIRRIRYARPALLQGLPKGFVSGVLEDYFTVASRSDPPLCASAVAIARDAIRNLGGFPVGIDSGEDLLTWAKLAVTYKIAYSTEPLAIFWAPESAQQRPGRAPATPDQVGKELARLLTEHDKGGLQEYVAMWHRMRGAIFLQLANRSEARKEFAKAMELGASSASLVALFAISFLPGQLGRSAYLTLREFRARMART